MIEIDIAILVILIIIMIILGLILCLKVVKERENNKKIANKAKIFHKNLNNKNMNRDIKNLENIMKNKILDELIIKYGGYNSTIDITKYDWLENKFDYIKKEYEEKKKYYKEDYENKIKENDNINKKNIEKLKIKYKSMFEEDWKINKKNYIKFYKLNI
jgi:hypothetical protein